MAITQGNSTTGSTTGATSFSITKPAGLADGDVLCLIVTTNGGTGATITPPTGFNLDERLNGATTIAVATYYKVISSAAGEPATYDPSFDSSRPAGGVITAFSGVDNTTPRDVASSTVGGTGTTSVVMPSVTTVTNGAMLWAGVGVATTGAITVSPAPGMTEAQEVNAGRTTQAATESRPTAGATGSRTATLSSNAAFAAVMMALRPAGGTPGNATGDLGTVGISNPSPTPTAAATLTPAAATIAHTSPAPSISAAATVTPDAATVGWTGYAPTIGAGATLTPDAATVGWLGYAPSVSAGGAATANADLGTIGWLGYAPTVGVAASVTPDVASIGWTGYAPTLTAGAVLTADAGIIAWTAPAPSVSSLTGLVDMTLHARSTALTLHSRSTALTLPER